PRRHERLIAGKPAPTQRMGSARHPGLLDDQSVLIVNSACPATNSREKYLKMAFDGRNQLR
ncbi:hypothetical protein, partial [Ottowia beijingensis]|uniref:hypothetical protein n=1 Tax=Ottowia beijingensis TaxID=1207057 RepID=UPI002FDA45AB